MVVKDLIAYPYERDQRAMRVGGQRATRQWGNECGCDKE